MELKDCFTKNGGFAIFGFDPYRVDPGDPAQHELYNALFDEDGYATRKDEVYNMIVANKWDIFSDAVKYYFAAECLDLNCKGNYTAVYAWRH